VVVVKNGRVVAERYGDGFSEKTPLLGWSMTKNVSAAIIGTLVKDGKMAVTTQSLCGPWKADGRAAISVADMMAMSSGLEFNEDYGDVADVTRMLYLEPDMAGFAESKPLTGDVGKVFSYSSGTAVMLSRFWQDAIGDKDKALAWPRTTLFDPLDMRSAVLETDEQGTFVGSYLYPRHDWARFGQFPLQACVERLSAARRLRRLDAGAGAGLESYGRASCGSRHRATRKPRCRRGGGLALKDNGSGWKP
jgi:CubicO group peptidase (beta-lactamase class C family)